MLKTFCIFVGFVVLLGAGIAVAAWPRANASAMGFASTQQLMIAYQRVHEGMPASKLAELGFDPVRARRLSALGLMERFMPKDSFGFDNLDPALQSCFEGRSDCSAYIFPVAQSRAEAVLLVEGGRVTWKNVSGVSLAAARRSAKLAKY
jgi:hypothetical protein